MKKKHKGGSEWESLTHEQTTWCEETLLKDWIKSTCWNGQYKTFTKHIQDNQENLLEHVLEVSKQLPEASDAWD